MRNREAISVAVRCSIIPSVLQRDRRGTMACKLDKGSAVPVEAGEVELDGSGVTWFMDLGVVALC